MTVTLTIHPCSSSFHPNTLDCHFTARRSESAAAVLWQTVGYSEPRKINQFDFSYLGSTKLDLIIIVIGVHFSYYDPDRLSEMIRTFLPAVKEGVASREHWFMDNNRYCGPHAKMMDMIDMDFGPTPSTNGTGIAFTSVFFSKLLSKL